MASSASFEVFLIREGADWKLLFSRLVLCLEGLAHRPPAVISRPRALSFVFLAVLLAACLPFSEHPSLEQRVLVSDPAAAVRMPGAEELAQFGKERGDTVTGPAFATHAYLFGTQAGDEEVIAFYDRELRRLGWARDDDAVVGGSTDRYVSGWCRPRLTYRLAMKQERAFEPGVYQGKTFRTVFDAGLVAVRAGRTCHGR